jgi:hypothetical protein
MEVFRLIISCIADLIICFIYTFLGYFLMHNPPKRGNKIYAGYMSKYAKKSPEAWSFAQSYAGRKMFYTGIIALAVLLPVYIIVRQNTSADDFYNIRYVFLMLQVLPSFVIRIMTESALRKRFNIDGTAKIS